MATTMTLLQLRTAVRQRADMVRASGVYTNAFVTDAELNSYINQSYFGLYDLLVQKYGDDYFVATPQLITTDGTNYMYALAADCYKVLGVDLLIQGTNVIYTPIKRFNFGGRESNYYTGGTPQAGLNVRVWYIPRMTQLVADSDTCDGISGWTEYIIAEAAIKCKDKQESDTSVLQAELASVIRRIESAAENRDAGNPQTVVDVTSQGTGFPYGISYVAAVNNLKYRLSGNNIWLQNAAFGGYPGGIF